MEKILRAFSLLFWFHYGIIYDVEKTSLTLFRARHSNARLMTFRFPSKVCTMESPSAWSRSPAPWLLSPSTFITEAKEVPRCHTSSKNTFSTISQGNATPSVNDLLLPPSCCDASYFFGQCVPLNIVIIHTFVSKRIIQKVNKETVIE